MVSKVPAARDNDLTLTPGSTQTKERTDSCQLSPELHMCPDPIHINTINLGSSRKAPGIFQDAVTFNLTFMEFQVFHTPSLVFLLTK